MMIQKIKKWLSGPTVLQDKKLEKRLCSLERRLRDFEENTMVNLYLYVDGKKIAVKEGFFNIPPVGSFLVIEEEPYFNYYFKVQNVLFSELGFCIDLHGQLTENCLSQDLILIDDQKEFYKFSKTQK